MYQMKHKNYDRFWVDKYIIPLANIVYSSPIKHLEKRDDANASQ